MIMQDSLALTGRESKPSGIRESPIGNLVGLIRHIDDTEPLPAYNGRSTVKPILTKLDPVATILIHVHENLQHLKTLECCPNFWGLKSKGRVKYDIEI